MILTKTIDNRWIRKYKTFLLIGVVILLFQIALAIRFFALNSDKVDKISAQNPYKFLNTDNDLEVSVNSARRVKDGLVIDDEDNLDQQKLKWQQAKKSSVSHLNKIKNNNSHLRLEELDFVPSCEINAKEAISAIHRAKTQKCKQTIANITCLINQGVYYPTRLPNYCPNNGLKAGKSLGCFKDEKAFRLLSGYYGNYKTSNSPEFCIRLCLQSGFPYAGVQYSTECFCGDTEPSSTARLPDSSCNMKCPVNAHQACGGYYTVNIYQTGISKFIPQIAETPTAGNNSSSAKIVFLLTLNGRALRQVKRLLKVLYHRDHYYYIHVDVRQDYLFRELLHLENQFHNVRLTRKRFATIWGGASLLQMLLSCMHELLLLDWRWDFVLNLSESDYPVKTLSRLVEFLGANKNKNFVKSHGREVQRFIQKQGLDKTFIECDTHMWRTGDRKLPWGIQVDGGSDWVALSKQFVAYVATDTPDDLVKGLLIIFKHTLLPAESFFHTVLRNSKFCNTYVDNNLHVTNWKRKLGCKCQYKHVVDWCGCSPNDFKPEDWLRIQNTETRSLYFARKFEPIINQEVILQLEQWLYETDALKNVKNVNSYWHSIYNYLDLTPAIDDSLLTVSTSAIRIKFKNMSGKYCTLTPLEVLEVFSFHKNDVHQKTVITFEAGLNLTKIKLETAIKPRKTFEVLKPSTLTKRLQSLAVSNEYDQKEQVLRNFARILGPYSETVLVYHFSSGANAASKFRNATFLWIDPAGHLMEASEIAIEDAVVTGHVKPAFKQPLLPGIWTVKMIENSKAVAETKFLITPLEFLSGNDLSHSQVNFIHSGSDVYKDFDSKFDQFLPNAEERDILERLAISNAKRFGLDLKEWIDALFNKFFTITDVCVVSKFIEICGNKVVNCVDTSWSSYAPDPKSFIGSINETSGTFNLW